MPIRRLALCACACALGLGLSGIAGADSWTVQGQTAADTVCMVGSNFVAVQLSISAGTPYVFSAPGNVTYWSAAGGYGGQEALVVVRPTGTPLEYRVVGSTPAQTLTDPLSRFKVGKVKVKKGDLIAFWVEDETLCAHATNDTGDVVGLFLASSGPPAVGTVATVSPIQSYRLNMSATVTARG